MENKITIYRKYRPDNFNSIAGHKNIVEILKKQLKTGKIAQSFLFAGQRGTGKTSIARILAKSVNCSNLIDGLCCDTCKNCVASNNQQNPDILEMDAASNNGVDEIREIKTSVSTLPVSGRYKVYIIDEVHMLTKSAFNALLKTLEEPPKHVIFVLATTEYAKIPSTIISRCQIFNFKKIDKQSIKERLNFIVNEEGFEIENEALSEIATLCDGSLRDGCNMLEQLFNIVSSKITIGDLKSIFYIASKNEKIKLIENVINGQPKKIVEYFETAESQGMDFDVFALSLIEIIKEIIEFKFLKDFKDLSVMEEKDLAIFEDVDISRLFEIADNLSDAYAKTKGTNINFNYLLISLLRSLSAISKHDNFDPEPINYTQQKQNTETKTQPIQNIEAVGTKTPEHQVYETNIEQKEFDAPITQEVVENQSNKVKKENTNPVVNGEITKCETPTSLKYEIAKEILELDNKKTYEVQISEVVNLLSKASKTMREEIALKVDNLFEKDDNQRFLNIDLANEMKPLFGFQVIAVSEGEILLRHPNFKNVKLLLFSLLQKPFQERIIHLLGDRVIIPISEMFWEDVKIEYKKLKDKNSIPNYVKTNLGAYYNNKKQSLVKKFVSNETLKAVSELFDLDSVEIED